MTKEAMVEAIRAGAKARAWDDDAYLKPTLEDDGALFGWEAYVEGREEEEEEEERGRGRRGRNAVEGGNGAKVASRERGAEGAIV